MTLQPSTIQQQSQKLLDHNNCEISTYKSTDKVYQSASSVIYPSLTSSFIIDNLIQQNNQQTKNFRLSKQQHRNTYTRYFKNVEDKAEHIIHKYFQNYERCIQHKIIMLENFRYNITPFARCFIQILGVQNFGTTVTYQIQISLFKIQVYLLNIIYKSVKLISVGEGQFGKIKRINCGNDQCIASKRIYFKKQKILSFYNDQKVYLHASKQEIEEVLMEYAIYKICSFFQIGPKIVSIGEFDIICFHEAIEFYMEECRESKQTDFKEDQMKLGLRILHKLKIIHKDIKPSNILYSYAYSKYVFTDFGLSHTVIQKFGYLSQSYRQGTILYMSDQMKKIKEKQMIDLYYNDYICFIKSVEQILKLQNVKKQSINQSNICDQYRCINIFGILLKSDSSQLSSLLNRYEQWNSKLLKQLIRNLSQNNIFRIIKLLEVLQKHKLNELIQSCWEFFSSKKKLQKMQKNHLQFLIRVYGIDVDIIELCLKNSLCIPVQISQHIITVYGELKYNRRQNLIFIAQNQGFEKYLITRLSQFNQNILTRKQKRQKLYLLKNLIQIEQKIYLKNISILEKYIKKIKELDQDEEYNLIIELYNTIFCGKSAQIIQIYNRNPIVDNQSNKIIEQVIQFSKILKQRTASHENLINIIQKVSRIQNTTIYYRRIFRNHEINLHQQINSNLKYRLLQSQKLYLNFQQHILFTIFTTIQCQVQSLTLFKQNQDYLLLIEKYYLDNNFTNRRFLEIFYYTMSRFYKLSQQICKSISYIHKFLDVYKTNPNFTIFESCQYYFQIAQNYDYISDFEKAIEYYVKIKKNLYWSEGQNTFFAYYVDDHLYKCYYWLNNQKNITYLQKYKQTHEKQIEFKKMRQKQLIEDVQLYFILIKKDILEKVPSLNMRYYLREIIYMISIICIRQQSEYYLNFLKNLYHKQKFLELIDHIQNFMIHYQHNLKYQILWFNAKISLQGRFHKNILYYIKAYIDQQLINPSNKALQNTYQIIHKLHLKKKYLPTIYFIHICFKFWQNHQIYCLYMKLADCYKNSKNSIKCKKYLVKAIINKLSKKQRSNAQIIQKVLHYGSCIDAILLIHILQSKFNYDYKKIFSLKSKILKKYPKLLQLSKFLDTILYKQNKTIQDELKILKIHKYCKMIQKKILRNPKVIKIF